MLGDEHNLSREKRDNWPVILNNLKMHLETTITTLQLTFHLGKQHVLRVLLLLLLAPAGSRPDLILQVLLGDLEILLHRPEKSSSKLFIYMQLNFTKTKNIPKAICKLPIRARVYRRCTNPDT